MKVDRTLDELKNDSDFQLFFENELEAMKNKVYEREYPELKARSFLPNVKTASLGQEFISFLEGDYVGQAAFIADGVVDIPTVDVYGSKNQSPIRVIASSYRMGILEAAAAQQAGTSLEARRARAMRDVIENKLDDIAGFGAADYGLKGFANHSAITATTLPDGASGSSSTWASKTDDEKLADLFTMSRTMVENSKGRLIPTDMVLPLSSYLEISTNTYLETGITLLQHFLANDPFIQRVDHWHMLDTAGSAPDSSKRAVVYRRDEDVATFELVQPFRIMGTDKSTMEWRVTAIAATGGVIVYKPLGMSYWDGM